MEVFITVMSVTGFVAWVLLFAWGVGKIGEWFGVSKWKC